MDEKRQLPGWVGGCVGALMALIILGTGLFIILISTNLLPFPEENFKAPRPVITAAGLVFFLAGFLMLMGMIFSPGELRLPVMQWIQFLLVLAVMVAFSGVLLWAGFGPGEHEFQSSVGAGPVSVRGQGNEFVGRLLFGGFGLLSGLGTAWYAYTQTNGLIHGRFKSIFERRPGGQD